MTRQITVFTKTLNPLQRAEIVLIDCTVYIRGVNLHWSHASITAHGYIIIKEYNHI